ncbi:hypothetical protein [Nocardioides speluncae]|uniref:hypothetical protein n=1 Tax=Nocardioides speluncae TaxID=2670337 RepID=UPI000D68C384|nr:hypothetical protein [Nocardioides speluncae]
MNEKMETRVKQTFDHRTDELVPPPVDVAALVRRGRRRRSWRSAGAAAVAVAVVGGTAYAAGTVAGDADPDPGRPTKEGLPVVTGGAAGPQPVDGPTAVFHTKSSVSIDGRTYPAGNFPWDTGPHVGQLGVAYPAKRTGVPHLMKRDGSQVALAPDRPKVGDRYSGWVAADAASPLVAWGEVGPTGVDVVAYDTAKGSEIARKRVNCQNATSSSSFGCAVPYVASDGVVFVHTNRPGTIAWRPADGTWQRLGDGSVSQAHGKVVDTFSGPDQLDLSVLGDGWSRLRLTGPFWEEQEKQGDAEALLSFDGSWVTDPEGKRVEDWHNPEATVTYDPPGSEVAAQYDTDGSMLYVTMSGDKYRAWDCTATARCEPLTEPTDEEIRLISWDL